MPRLSTMPGLLGAAIAAPIALWWLPAVRLQAAGGFSGVAALSARAAFYLVLAQGMLVCVFAARWFGGRRLAMCAVDGLSAVAPAWPLLVLLWLTSGSSGLVLAASQFLIVLAASVLALSGCALARSPLATPVSDGLRGAAGLAAAALAWAMRGDLQTWMVPG